MFGPSYRPDRAVSKCDRCGGMHETVPERRGRLRGGELGAACPHCGEWCGLGESDPADVETHPAVPDDEPVTVTCGACNGSLYVRVD